MFNLESLLAMYREPMFLLYPVATLLLSIVAFLAFALPWTWLAWKNPLWARKYRIQQDREIDVQRWFLPSLGRIAVNSSITFALLLLTWPVLRLSGVHWGALPDWYVVIAQLVFFIFLDDFLYYWMHRAMHLPWLYKHVHIVHHRPTTPCAIAGNYFHPAEFIATTSLVLVGPTLVGAHVVTVWIWVVFRQLEAADGHCGYDIPWNPTRFFPFYHGPAYHDFHHKRFFGNYAGFLSYADRFFGEYAKGYREYRASKRARGPAETSR